MPASARLSAALIGAATVLLLCSAAPAPGAVTAASFGNADGTLRLPEALAVAPDGTVLVGDHFSGRIQTFRSGRPAGGGLGMRGDVCGRLGAVSGVARAADGRVYVLDADEQRVHVFSADGALVRCFGGRGNGRGRLMTSSGEYAASTASGGIAVAGRFVYVADTGNDRVERFTLDGGSPKVLGRGRLRRPQGLAVRGSRLLVADDGSHRVVELTTTGRFVRATGGSGLRFPYDVALAANGHAYVADNNGHRIVVLDRRLRHVRSWGRFGSGRGRFVYPRAVAVTPAGNVLVADAGNDRVTEFTARGRYVRTLGTNGRRAGSVTLPGDVAANARGEIAVADRNLRISWFSGAGRWLGAWAQGRSFQQSTAVVTGPRSLAFAADDRVRVADGGTLKQLGPGEARDLGGDPDADLGGRGRLLVRAVDAAPDGTTWALVGRGRLAPVTGTALGTPVGQDDAPNRTSTDLALLSDGSIAVAEGAAENRPAPRDGVVHRYDTSGRRLSTWALARPAGGEPSAPAGVASDGAGGVWVSDAANGRLVRLGPDGAVLRTLGSPGTGPEQLSAPAGLTLDCAGALVVADAGNNRIVRFTGEAFGGPPRGCAAAPAPPTAAARLPRPAGLELRTTSRPRRPQRTLARVTARCARTCTVRAVAGGSVYGAGSVGTLDLTAQVSGRRITVVASGRALRRMRSALRRRDGRVSVGVTVLATTADGVRDVEATTLTVR
jgi:DNA-binding beta-propeller fold protein YncE